MRPLLALTNTTPGVGPLSSIKHSFSEISSVRLYFFFQIRRTVLLKLNGVKLKSWNLRKVNPTALLGNLTQQKNFGRRFVFELQRAGTKSRKVARTPLFLTFKNFLINRKVFLRAWRATARSIRRKSQLPAALFRVVRPRARRRLFRRLRRFSFFLRSRGVVCVKRRLRPLKAQQPVLSEAQYARVLKVMLGAIPTSALTDVRPYRVLPNQSSYLLRLARLTKEARRTISTTEIGARGLFHKFLKYMHPALLQVPLNHPLAILTARALFAALCSKTETDLLCFPLAGLRRSLRFALRGEARVEKLTQIAKSRASLKKYKTLRLKRLMATGLSLWRYRCPTFFFWRRRINIRRKRYLASRQRRKRSRKAQQARQIRQFCRPFSQGWAFRFATRGLLLSVRSPLRRLNFFTQLLRRRPERATSTKLINRNITNSISGQTQLLISGLLANGAILQQNVGTGASFGARLLRYPTVVQDLPTGAMVRRTAICTILPRAERRSLSYALRTIWCPMRNLTKSRWVGERGFSKLPCYWHKYLVTEVGSNFVHYSLIFSKQLVVLKHPKGYFLSNKGGAASPIRSYPFAAESIGVNASRRLGFSRIGIFTKFLALLLVIRPKLIKKNWFYRLFNFLTATQFVQPLVNPAACLLPKVSGSPIFFKTQRISMTDLGARHRDFVTLRARLRPFVN